uniref:ribosomal protein S11 n=1 Tax=Bostrychia tenuissima TaxID=196631 RepID=UPI002E7679E0|nr:ribosomal protein S11 [Bostrychia tenuissima]WQF69441.1 ribosomal protein S11 [Bostrychia tenuissima]
MFKHQFFLMMYFTFNNMFFTFTNFKGEVIFWRTVGLKKLKGLKKLNQPLMKFITKKLMDVLTDMKTCFHIKFVGTSRFKKTILKSFQNCFENKIQSMTVNKLTAYNGCKVKKRKRT